VARGDHEGGNGTRDLRGLRRLLPGDRDRQCRPRARRRPPRVPAHPARHRLHLHLPRSPDRPQVGGRPGEGICGGQRRPGDRHRHRQGHLRMAQPRPRAADRVDPGESRTGAPCDEEAAPSSSRGGTRARST
jgi:hypothetical protein